MLSLSIVIPCYNEFENLNLLIKKIESLFKFDVLLNVIIVNNGSTDGTQVFLDNYIKKTKFNIQILNIKENIGYGHGILKGVNIANGDIIAWTHADLQCDPKDTIDAYNKLIKYKNKKIILKGKRKGRGIIDYFFTLGMGMICSLYFRKILFDINAQPKMFYNEFKVLLKDAPYDFSLDLHLLLIGRKNNYRIIDHPVFFKKRNAGTAKGGGGSIKNKIKLIIRTLKYIIYTKQKWK
jgi:glycosyltransferase involved in cell wall biosynthesis